MTKNSRQNFITNADFTVRIALEHIVRISVEERPLEPGQKPETSEEWAVTVTDITGTTTTIETYKDMGTAIGEADDLQDFHNTYAA